MLFSCHFQILLTISEIQLTLHKVHTVHMVKSAVSLKWQVGFENGMKMTPIFTSGQGGFSPLRILGFSIPTRGWGADYAHGITACPSKFENLTASLIYIHTILYCPHVCKIQGVS